MSDAQLAELALTTQAVYERNAARFDAERPKGLHERVWLDRFAAGLPPVRRSSISAVVPAIRSRHISRAAASG